MSSLSEPAVDSGVKNPRASMEISKEGIQHFESSSILTAGVSLKVQPVANGGSIGTALFLSIGGVPNKAGPGNIALAFFVYNIMLALVNNRMAEMSVYMPVSGGFIRKAGKWADEALGCMAKFRL
ncbi:Fc.00g034590.m01.CDS01 [Cosmosporella sp. VM-42]